MKDWPHVKVSRQVKKLNPAIKVLLYESTEFGPHGWGNAALQAHPEWWLKDDNGKVRKGRRNQGFDVEIT